jgi:hypothetical protein
MSTWSTTFLRDELNFIVVKSWDARPTKACACCVH